MKVIGVKTIGYNIYERLSFLFLPKGLFVQTTYRFRIIKSNQTKHKPISVVLSHDKISTLYAMITNMVILTLIKL